MEPPTFPWGNRASAEPGQFHPPFGLVALTLFGHQSIQKARLSESTTPERARRYRTWRDSSVPVRLSPTCVPRRMLLPIGLAFRCGFSAETLAANQRTKGARRRSKGWEETSRSRNYDSYSHGPTPRHIGQCFHNESLNARTSRWVPASIYHGLSGNIRIQEVLTNEPLQRHPGM